MSATWWETPLGNEVLRWVEQQSAQQVADVFGFNAVQITVQAGVAEFDLLTANRIPLKFKIVQQSRCLPDTELRTVYGLPTELPIAAQSIDLVVLPFVLDFDDNPHQVLREVERILRPEGVVLIAGFNLWSLWGLHCSFLRLVFRILRRPTIFPWNGKYLSTVRLRDWLQLLGLEPDTSSLGCYGFPRSTQKQTCWRLWESLGRHCWPFAGGVYFLRAVKRVRGLRLLPPWAVRKKLPKSVLKPSLTSSTGIQQKEQH